MHTIFTHKDKKRLRKNVNKIVLHWRVIKKNVEYWYKQKEGEIIILILLKRKMARRVKWNIS